MLGNQLVPVPWTAPVRGLLTRVRAWPVTAQQHARRNAMVAATDCARRRIEREDVVEFLRDHERHRTAGTRPAAAATAPTARRAGAARA